MNDNGHMHMVRISASTGAMGDALERLTAQLKELNEAMVPLIVVLDQARLRDYPYTRRWWQALGRTMAREFREAWRAAC